MPKFQYIPVPFNLGITSNQIIQANKNLIELSKLESTTQNEGTNKKMLLLEKSRIKKLHDENKRLLYQIIHALFICDQVSYLELKQLLDQNEFLKKEMIEILEGFIGEFNDACELYRKDMNKQFTGGDVTLHIAKKNLAVSYTETLNNNRVAKEKYYEALALAHTKVMLSARKKPEEDEIDYYKNTLIKTCNSLYIRRGNNKTDVAMLYHPNLFISFLEKLATKLVSLFYPSPSENKNYYHHGHKIFFSANNALSRQIETIHTITKKMNQV